MQFVVRSVAVTWELARRLGPYLMLEILLPGGTLLALLLFLYRRRRVYGAASTRQNAAANLCLLRRYGQTGTNTRTPAAKDWQAQSSPR